MTPQEIRQLIKRRGETMVEFARHFGVPGDTLSVDTIKAWLISPDSPRFRRPSPTSLKILQQLQNEVFRCSAGMVR